MKRIIFLLLLSILFTAGNIAQERHYRLWLSDKGGGTYSLERPEEFLSPEAIARREKRNIAIDSTDLPVEPTRLQQIAQAGAQILTTSRWLNTVTISIDQITLLPTILALPYVEEWDDLGSPIQVERESAKLPQTAAQEGTSYGEAYWQIALHNGDKLHQSGFKGKGMTIAVIDAGFRNANINPLFNQEQIIGTHDFIDKEIDFINGHSHGANVLSTMLANNDKTFIGTAPEANYWLLRTENAATELPIEEDYWAAAVEYADSLGIELITTSLGYYHFDDTRYNHTWEQLDGKTAFISQAAVMGVQKGLLILASAGNEGGSEWRKISFPADVDGVLTVGAISSDKKPAYFTGQGFTADDRVKPDVVALGAAVSIINPSGQQSLDSGTSYSTPILAGLTACLWQALPELSAQEIIGLIQRSSSQYHAPDSLVGYGIPDLYAAYQQGTGVEGVKAPNSPLQISYRNGTPIARFNNVACADTSLVVRAYNTDGTLVRIQILIPDDEMILNDLPAGLYLLVARGESNYWTHKIQCP